MGTNIADEIEVLGRVALRQVVVELAQRHNLIVRDIRKWQRLANSPDRWLRQNEEGEVEVNADYHRKVVTFGREIEARQQELADFVKLVQLFLGMDDE